MKGMEAVVRDACTIIEIWQLAGAQADHSFMYVQCTKKRVSAFGEMQREGKSEAETGIEFILRSADVASQSGREKDIADGHTHSLFTCHLRATDRP